MSRTSTSKASSTAFPQFPLAAGHWQIGRGGLECGLAGARLLKVAAPSALLRQILDLCNGFRAWADVLDHVALRWDHTTATQLLAYLSAQGALVEARMALADAGRRAWNPYATAGLASDDQALRLAAHAERDLHYRAGNVLSRQRPSRLRTLLDSRGSAHSFSGLTLSAEALEAILWAAYGVTSPQGGHFSRRTVPSGGALYGLQWYLVLLRPAGTFAAGRYRVRYRQNGHVALERLAGAPDGAWLALNDPRVLTFAQGVLFPVIDLPRVTLKYGDRALFLALIELGHACQNAALMAASLGAATCMRGDAIESEVLHLFGADDAHFPSCALVIGGKPNAVQERQAAIAAGIALHWRLPHATRDGAGSHAALAGPLPVRTPVPMWTGGRDRDPRTAVVKAEAEAWERIGWASPPALKMARFVDMSNAIDPRTLVNYSPWQYAQPEFAFTPFSGRRNYPWVNAVDLPTGKTVMVMAQCAYRLDMLPPVAARAAFTSASTSGMAAWTTVAGALQRATLELIERDALALAWIGRKAVPAVLPTSLPATLRMRIETLREAGLDATLLDLTREWVPVAAILVRKRNGGAIALGAGAGFTFEEASLSALAEAESLGVKLMAQRGAGSVHTARDVRLPEDHIAMFQNRRTAQRTDFLENVLQYTSFAKTAKARACNWEALQSRLYSAEYRTLVVDQTPQGAGLEQGRTALHVMRVFIPGLVPIWFGYGNEPAALARLVHAASLTGLANPRKLRQHAVHPFG